MDEREKHNDGIRFRRKKEDLQPLVLPSGSDPRLQSEEEVDEIPRKVGNSFLLQL